MDVRVICGADLLFWPGTVGRVAGVCSGPVKHNSKHTVNAYHPQSLS